MNVCKRARSLVEGERCVVSNWFPLKRLEVNDEEKKKDVHFQCAGVKRPCVDEKLECVDNRPLIRVHIRGQGPYVRCERAVSGQW